MKFFRYILFSLLGVYTAQIGFDLSVYETLSVLLFINYFLYFIGLVGKKIILLEIACLVAILTWLIAPIPFYHYFNEHNYHANLWKVYMPVDSDVYYGYVFWGTVSMIIGMSLKLKYNFMLSTSGINFEYIKNQLKNRKYIAYYLIFVGLFSNVLIIWNPISQLSFILYLLNKLYLVGLLYLYFSTEKYSVVYLIAGMLILLLLSVKNAMFGEFVYYSMLSFFLIFSRYRVSFLLKLSFVIVGFMSILLLQTVKKEYRKTAWDSGGSVGTFGSLIVKNTSSISALLQNEAVNMALLTRLNQGFLIAKTIETVPAIKPYAYGATIVSSLTASLVPRIIWPTKPQSGGKFNLERFADIHIKGYSMNISPIGEAYGNFSRMGGIVFMFLYGFLLNFVLNKILKIAHTRPLLLIWLPFLFLYTIGTETDILSTFNYFLKSGIFFFILYYFNLVFFKFKIV
ncbi:MAG: hypothetical protein IT263_12800 [Saprospiraceae bacterium]|nr:hypothetical protein [Saprospiraceae bacterium]